MSNIRFNYRYRDGANYKNHGFVIFENIQIINLDSLLSLIKSKLIDETWFCAGQWKLPDLHFGTWDNTIDHTWHEFENVEYTNETPTAMDITDFITLLKSISLGEDSTPPITHPYNHSLFSR